EQIGMLSGCAGASNAYLLDLLGAFANACSVNQDQRGLTQIHRLFDEITSGARFSSYYRALDTQQQIKNTRFAHIGFTDNSCPYSFANNATALKALMQNREIIP